MASPNAKDGYEADAVQQKPPPKFHMAVDSEYKVRNHMPSACIALSLVPAPRSWGDSRGCLRRPCRRTCQSISAMHRFQAPLPHCACSTIVGWIFRRGLDE